MRIGVRVAATRPLNEQRFFGSFFQKRTASLPFAPGSAPGAASNGACCTMLSAPAISVVIGCDIRQENASARAWRHTPWQMCPGVGLARKETALHEYAACGKPAARHTAGKTAIVERGDTLAGRLAASPVVDVVARALFLATAHNADISAGTARLLRMVRALMRRLGGAFGLSAMAA